MVHNFIYKLKELAEFVIEARTLENLVHSEHKCITINYLEQKYSILNQFFANEVKRLQPSFAVNRFVVVRCLLSTIFTFRKVIDGDHIPTVAYSNALSLTCT